MVKSSTTMSCNIRTNEKDELVADVKMVNNLTNEEYVVTLPAIAYLRWKFQGKAEDKLERLTESFPDLTEADIGLLYWGTVKWPSEADDEEV